MQRLTAGLLVATLTLLCGGVLSACGQKGPLYLPQDTAVTTDAPAADTNPDIASKPSKD